MWRDAMSSLNILALDLGTTTGWAHSNGASGTWDLSIRRDESSGMRLLRFEAKLLEIINTVGVDVIVLEAALATGSRPAGMEPVRLQSKLQAIIERLVESTDVFATVCGIAIPNMEPRDLGVRTLTTLKDEASSFELAVDESVNAFYSDSLAPEIEVSVANSSVCVTWIDQYCAPR